MCMKNPVPKMPEVDGEKVNFDAVELERLETKHMYELPAPVSHKPVHIRRRLNKWAVVVNVSVFVILGSLTYVHHL